MNTNATNAPEPSFSIGDPVMLASGGPGMTVVDIGRSTGLVWCRWLCGDGKLLEHAFPAQAIRLDPRTHCRQP